MNPIKTAIDAGTIPPRPSAYHPAIRRAIAERMAKDVGAYLGEPAEALIDDLYSVHTPNADGYELARALDEKHGWDIDTGLVDLLDGTALVESQILDDAESEWVKAHKLTVPFPPGTHVSWTDYEKPHTGYITDDSNRYPGKSLIKDDAIPPEAARLAIVEWERLDLNGGAA